MNQWEKYDVDWLLDIADSTNAPDENGEWGYEQMFDAKDGWKVSIFYDCGELDYIEHFVAPDGEVIDFWKWPDTYLPNGDYDHDHRHPRNRLMAWRGVRRPETEEAPNPWDALKSMTAADIVERTLAFNAANNAFVQFATANRDRYAAAADLAILLKRALSTGAISWERAEAACGVEGIVVYDLTRGLIDGFDVDRLREMAAAVEKAAAETGCV